MENLAAKLETAAARAELDQADLARVLDTAPAPSPAGSRARPRRAPKPASAYSNYLLSSSESPKFLRHDPHTTVSLRRTPRLDHYKPFDLVRARRAREVLGAIDAMAEGVVA